MALDPYAILGIEPDATQEEIRKAYRAMASIHHPDKNLDDPFAKTRFQQVKTAYEILKYPTRRARFDGGESTDKFDIRGASVGLLIQVFFDVLQQGDQHIIFRIKEALDVRSRTTGETIRENKNIATNLLRVKRNFSHSGDGRNFLADAIDSQHEKVAEMLKNLKREAAVTDHAKVVLGEFAD